VDEDDLFMIYWADCFDQIHSVRPDFKRVDKGFELLLESLILDPQESRVDSAEEQEDASVVRVSLKTRIRDTAMGSVSMARAMRILPMMEKKPMLLRSCSVTL